MRFVSLLLLPLLAAPVAAGAQAAPSMADRLMNDPRVEALRPYGLPIAPSPRTDKDVQFGKMLRIPLKGHADFARIGVTAPTLKPVKKGDRIVIAFWARARETQDGKPGRIGRAQLEATPVIRAVFEQAFDIGPDWKMYQLKGTADADYAPGALNAALHIDAAKQVLDLGPLFIFNYGQATP
jgi:hypothetical protein